MSKNTKRQFVSLAAVLVLVFLYLLLAEKPWAIYVAICGAYTVLVFGLLWSDGKWARYIEEGKRTARELIQGHLVFVLVLALWIWLCRFSRPWLPGWLFNYGLGEITLYFIFSGLGIVAMWWGEQSWLARTPPKEELVRSSSKQ